MRAKHLFLAIASSMVICSSAFAAGIDLKLKNVSVQEAIAALNKMENYSISLNADDVDITKVISVDAKGATIEEVLDQIFAGQKVSYVIDGTTVSISKKTDTSATRSDRKTDRVISGTVYDQNNQPVPGAAVMITGTMNGAVTDANGRYSINVNGSTKSLTVNCLGFTEKMVAINPKSDRLDITIEEDAIAIEGTVVVGYGVQKKVNLTGAIATVESESLENRVAPTLTHMLQGSVPGLNITTDSGRPGNSAAINIRGTNSINGGNPLVLVDGAEMDLLRVNPNDVESISVIKDASAAAIYGARASFGVILVTTKNGAVKDGKATVRVSSRFGWEEPTTSTEFETRGYYSVYLNDLFYHAQNGTNYTTYTEEDMQQLWARRNDKTEDPSRPWVMIDQREGRNTYVYYANTDWYHELFQDRRPNQQHNVTLSGGTEHVKYFISGGYNKEDGIFRKNTDNNKKVNFRSKLTFDVNKWLSFSNNTSFYRSKYDYPGRSGVNTAFSLMTVHALASYPAHNPDGTSIGYTSFASNNYVMDGMLTVLDNPDYTNGDTNTNFSTTTEATVTPFSKFVIKANFTYSFNQYYNMNRSVNTCYSRYPGEILWVTNSNSINKLQEINQTQNYYATNVYGTYTDTFARNHHLKVMGGFNWETKHYKDITSIGYYLMSDSLNDLNLIGPGEDGETRMEVKGGQNEYAIEGFFGRLNYDYKEKYLLEVSGRFDGSSRFAADSRWGFFPSMSAGWKVSEERFFAPLKDTMNTLKFRYSYGALGNQQVGYYDYVRKVTISKADYSFGTGAFAPIANIGAPVASDLTWERALQHDLGLDAAFLGNKLTLTLDGYIRDTKDMLIAGAALPATYGASAPKMNAADLRTKGYEIMVNWRDSFSLAGKPFNYGVSASLSDYVTDITKYDNPTKSFAKTYYVGQRLGEIWGYHTDGLFRTDEEAANYAIDQTYVNSAIKSAAGDEKGLHAGDVKFLDLTGDGKVNVGENTADNPGDRTIIGNSNPRYNYGLNLSASWVGFDFSIFFQGVGKMNWYPTTNNVLFWGPYARPYATLMPRDFHTMIWSEENPDSYLPRPRGYVALGDNRELTVPNDRYIQNIAYCRLKNLSFGYTLPKSLTQKANISNVRVYFSGENLAYFSPFKAHSRYIDPEMAQTNTQMRIYPWQRSFMFGIDITL